MGAPVVFVSRLRIVDGRRPAFVEAFGSVIEAIDQEKPRTALYAAYLDATGATVQIVHAFPDADAMAVHFEGSEERTQSVSQLVTLAGFSVYGPAPSDAIDQLRREAAATGSSLDLLVDPLGGFIRAPA
jgi:hypothetical protein